MRVYEQWAAALESGEFEQCRKGLQSGCKFCVLGVLIILAERAGIELTEIDRDNQGQLTGGFLRHYPQVVDWAGLRSPVPKYRNEIGEGHTLTSDNDEGATFPELAATIRKYKDQLFKD